MSKGQQKVVIDDFTKLVQNEKLSKADREWFSKIVATFAAFLRQVTPQELDCSRENVIRFLRSMRKYYPGIETEWNP